MAAAGRQKNINATVAAVKKALAVVVCIVFPPPEMISVQARGYSPGTGP